MIMAKDRQARNDVKNRRLDRGWSQHELAARAGISRAAVSAIEINRLVPSVAAALALAQSFDCSVEDLFGQGATRRRTRSLNGPGPCHRNPAAFGKPRSVVGGCYSRQR